MTYHFYYRGRWFTASTDPGAKGLNWEVSYRYPNTPRMKRFPPAVEGIAEAFARGARTMMEDKHEVTQ